MSKKSWASPLVVAILAVGLIGCDSGSRNGSSGGMTAPANGPDLQITNAMLPTNSVSGFIPTAMNSTATVLNTGATAAGSFSVAIVSGTNGTMLNRITDRQDFTGGLGPGQMAMASATARGHTPGVPTMGMNPSSIILGFLADSQNSVLETNEMNNLGVNQAAGTITNFSTTMGADLCFASFIGFATGSPTLTAPSSFMLTFDIQNAGDTNAPNQFTIGVNVIDAMGTTESVATQLQNGVQSFSAPITVTIPCMYTGSSGGAMPTPLMTGAGVLQVQLDTMMQIMQPAMNPNDTQQEAVILQ